MKNATKSTPTPAAEYNQSVGQNVNLNITGNILTITVDLSVPGTRSASGKSTVIGTTRGNVTTPSGVTVGLNVYTK